MKLIVLFGLGIISGGLVTLQSVLNAGLGKRAGNLGSVFLLTVASLLFVVLLLALFPGTANLKGMPGPKEWYLYAGGILGVGVVAAPILLVPRIGATSTLTAIVVGQLLVALIVDHFGWLGSPKIEIGLLRVVGVALLALGAYFIARR